MKKKMEKFNGEEEEFFLNFFKFHEKKSFVITSSFLFVDPLKVCLQKKIDQKFFFPFSLKIAKTRHNNWEMMEDEKHLFYQFSFTKTSSFHSLVKIMLEKRARRRKKKENFSPVNSVKCGMFTFVLWMFLDIFSFATTSMWWKFHMLWQIYLFLISLGTLYVRDSNRWRWLYNSGRRWCHCGGFYRRQTCGLCCSWDGVVATILCYFNSKWGGGERW